MGLTNHLFSLTPALSQRERESFKSLNLMALRSSTVEINLNPT
jgi:hypothetical protein